MSHPMAERGIFSIVFIIRHRCHSWWLPFMTYFSRSHWEIPSHWVLIFPTVDFGRHIYPEPCIGILQVFSQMAAMSPSVSILVHGGCCKKCHRLSGLHNRTFYLEFWRLRCPRSRHPWRSCLVRANFLLHPQHALTVCAHRGGQRKS